jgi:hypothetical protein
MQWIEGRLAAARTIANYLATYPASYAAAQIGWIGNALDLAAWDCPTNGVSGLTRRA